MDGSTFHSPSPDPLAGFFTQEIYLINPDPNNLDPQRLTFNEYGDGFPMLSPDGKKIVFDSNRFTADPAIRPDPGTLRHGHGIFPTCLSWIPTAQTRHWLTRGSTADWSPDSKDIVFHASASYYKSGGTETVLSPSAPFMPGFPSRDSDIFVANVDDLAAAQDIPTKTQLVTNITNTPDLIEHDADWSPSTATAPDGLIAFASFTLTQMG